jgi:ATP-dependent Zn protease
VLLSISIFQFFSRSRRQEMTITYTEFRQQLEDGNIDKVTIIEKDVHGELKSTASKVTDGKLEEYAKFLVHIPFEMPELIDQLEAQEVAIEAEPLVQFSTVHFALGLAVRHLADHLPPDAGWWAQGNFFLWQEQSQAADPGSAKGHLRRCGRGR